MIDIVVTFVGIFNALMVANKEVNIVKDIHEWPNATKEPLQHLIYVILQISKKGREKREPMADDLLILGAMINIDGVQLDSIFKWLVCMSTIFTY